ncbi:hypothetical protein CKO11_03210 [Rhodobacter sp. TJ_12]|uniref:Hint domain-containing protein n=1 Tax=Rhodobacter sp. TJ_12 TaxID=2029399 RepID=UPI001CBDC7C4|nr:Hint domain-containing protein [Rhodobacter sp. TJ_12]MBZ4021472.1 hypothetical protein [Rhodobacter sp. TJ_12]
MTVFRDTFADVFHFDKRMETTGQNLRGSDEFLDLAQGFYGDTVLQTARGLRRVSNLIEGDRIRTFANGSRPIEVIERFPIERLQHPLPERFWPLELPAGLFGNDEKRLIAPEQCLVLHSELAQIELDKPLLLMPAKVLSLLPEVRAVNPGPKAMLYRLRFETPELVLSARGAVFLCDIGSMFDDWADLDPHDTLAHMPNVAALPFDEAYDMIRREIEIDGGAQAHFEKHLEQMKRCAQCHRVVSPPTLDEDVPEIAQACRATCPREWAAE